MLLLWVGQLLWDARMSLKVCCGSSLLIHRGTIFHFFPCWIAIVTINPDVWALGGKKQLYQGAAQHCKPTLSSAVVLRNCNTSEIHSALAFLVQKHNALIVTSAGSCYLCSSCSRCVFNFMLTTTVLQSFLLMQCNFPL